MGNPYTQPSLSGYNSNPPADDGSAVATNEITWAKHKNKFGDPLKTYSAAISTNVLAAFALLPFRTISAISGNTTVATGDRGTHYNCTGTFTLTLPAAGDATISFVISGQNAGTGVVTIDADSSETINGVLTVAIPSGTGFVLVCDGSNWTAIIGTRPGAKGVDVASASDLLVNIDGSQFDVTGSVQIDTIATKGIGTVIVLQFDGAPTLAHDATNLILPGAANITPSAGDVAVNKGA